uniref:Uncharacterized protein n=1 Tax=Solanum lycopersicum TaxID=4081 RepID=A0A3Q7JA85_SOLLC
MLIASDRQTKAEISSLVGLICFFVTPVYFVGYIVDTLFVAFSNTSGRMLPEILPTASLEHKAIIGSEPICLEFETSGEAILPLHHMVKRSK